MRQVIKYIAAFICCLIFWSCSAARLENSKITKPEVIEQYPLPPLPSSIYESTFIIYFNLYIAKDGSVQDVFIKDDRVSKKWIAEAKSSILKWKYTPALENDKPISIWIIQKTIIKIEQPLFMVLSEMQFDSLSTAQKVFNLLKEKKDFGKLARSYSTANSSKIGGYLGKVNIIIYPETIKEEILKLKYDDFTPPLKYAGKFVIFKRLKD